MIARGKRSFFLATALLLAVLPGGAGLAAARAESGASSPPIAAGPAEDPAPSPGLRLDRDAARLLDRDNLLILAAGGALAALTWNAIDADRTAGRLHASSLDGLYDFGNEYGSGVTMGAGSALLLGIGAASGQPSLTRLGGDLLRGFTLSSGLAWGLKATFQRRRPGGGPHSFPSGHTAIAFCAAPILTKHLGWRGGALAYGVAASTAFGRLEDRRHYGSDVIFGAALGLAVGRAVAGRTGLERFVEHVEVGPGGFALSLGF